MILLHRRTYEVNTSDLDKSRSFEPNRFQFDYKCTWCGKKIETSRFYRCSICNFCFEKSPLLFIESPKSHHHSLFFYPRPLLSPCDACGLVNVLDPSYACFQCNYMVHQSCIHLPRVIKITRHQHRLFHTPFLGSTTSLCRICYKSIDIKYGQYFCNEEGCSYVSHSKCATHEDIWDMKELEWEPEDPDESEDIHPFEKVGIDMIKHFSHEHILKLQKFDGVRDAEKRCQACILPINSRDFYNCIQCDFFLHEVCAGLLRKLNHALHIHPLRVDTSPVLNNKYNTCLVCSRVSTGFRHRCSKGCKFFSLAQINVCCILVPDYFNHKAHEHPLSLCYGEKVEGTYWCEVCEKEVDPTVWFYICNECCTTIHRSCLYKTWFHISSSLSRSESSWVSKESYSCSQQW